MVMCKCLVLSMTCSGCHTGPFIQHAGGYVPLSLAHPLPACGPEKESSILLQPPLNDPTTTSVLSGVTVETRNETLP